MTTPSCLIELKNVLPKISWSKIIPALRQDALILQALQNPDFRGLAISKLGSHPERWTPAHLALLSLGSDLNPQELKTKSLAELNAELRLQAIQVYEAHNADVPPKMTLKAAGLLSLALLEHHRQSKSWAQIPHTEHWKTAMACLFGLVDQPLPFLLTLPVPLVIHAILANPLTLEEQAQIFTGALLPSTTHKRLALLRELANYRPELTTVVARKLWKVDEHPETDTPRNDLITLLPAFESLQTFTDALSSSLAHAEAQLAAGYSLQAASSLQIAWDTSRQLQHTLATQTAQVAASQENFEQAQNDWEKAQTPPEVPIESTAMLALTFLEKGQSQAAQDLLNAIENSTHAAALLTLAWAASQNDQREIAKEKALKAAQNLSELNAHQLLLLTELLLDLKQATEAVRVLEFTWNIYPNHIQLIRISGQVYAAAGAYPSAIQAIHLAIALEPDRLETLRDYAQIHAYAGQWPAAIDAAKYIIEIQNTPAISDYHSLAEFAINLNQWEQAVKACQAALELDSEDGIALAFVGEALYQMGEHEVAHEHLQKALRYAADRALPWLILARTQQWDGALTEASETLRKGALAAPDDAEIHLALGNDYLRSGSTSQALASLRKANKLTENNAAMVHFHLRSQIALPLAKTLYALGHAEEALETIESSPTTPKNQAELLHLRAQILLFLGRADEAIPLLAKALMANPSDPTINLDYARAQLEANIDPSKAINALLALLENDPGNPKALALLAEALKANHDPASALVAYRKALATCLSDDPNWYPKLSIGLAQTALELDQPEIALAALQHNWQTSPQNQLIITQTLAEAYKAANLEDKAIRTARSARDLAPLILENLIWFAGFTSDLNAFDEAVDALNCAIELKPRQAGLLLDLGLVHKKVGDIKEARQVFKLIAKLEEATPRELRTSAQYLMELNHPEDAVVCQKLAVQRCLDDPKKEACLGLITELIESYLALEMYPEALMVLEEYGEQKPETKISLMEKRVTLLFQLDRADEAITLMEQALDENPKSTALLLAAAQINYLAGNLLQALLHSEEAIEMLSMADQDVSVLATLAQAADLTLACLQESKAHEIIEHPLATSEESDSLAYYCLRAELALRLNNEIDAAESLTNALKISEKHPRVMALQARLTARHGGTSDSQQAFQEALQTWGGLSTREISSPVGLLAIAEAALELHQWSSAIYLLQEAVDLFPQEPRTHLQLARGLVLRAEHQRLCETLRVVRHAPGDAAIADYVYQTFEGAILKAVEACKDFDIQTFQTQITHWRTRGHAVFQPSAEHARALTEIHHTQESRAALLAALRHSREKQLSKQSALNTLATVSQNLASEADAPILLLAQIALSINRHNPKLATNAAQAALDASIRQKHPAQPIFYTVQAMVAEQTGEMEEAYTAIENALSHWNDEPHWHIWAADIQQNLKAPNEQAEIDHLKQAVEIEPKHGNHHYRLGQVYLKTGDYKAAIPELENATRLLPNHSQPWLALAHANQEAGDIKEIFRCAEKALELDPKKLDAHLILATSALEIGNPEKAFEYCQNALQIDAENPQALLLKARSLDRIGQSTEALESFDQALKRVPKSVPLMIEHAQIIQRAQGSRSAVKVLQTLADEHPDDPTVMATLADALVESEQGDPAIQAAQKALLNNQNGDLDCEQEAHLLETLGRLMRQNGQLDHAIHYLSEAIQCDAESVDAYLELGRVYQDRRQYAQALDALNQAIAIAPHDARPYYQAGQVLKASKDYTAAEEMLQNAAKLAPNDLAIRRQLGGLIALNLVHNPKEEADLYVD